MWEGTNSWHHVWSEKAHNEFFCMYKNIQFDIGYKPHIENMFMHFSPKK